MSSAEILNVQWSRSEHSCALHSPHYTPMYTVQCTKLQGEHGVQCTKQYRVQGEAIESSGLFDDWGEILGLFSL